MKKFYIFAPCPKNGERSLLHKSLKSYDLLKYADIVSYNREPLPVAFNKAIDKAIEDDVDYLILCHDDITIESGNLFEKIDILMENFDVVGVAGTASAALKKPALWHLMSSDVKDISCTVAHYIDISKSPITQCYSINGIVPRQAILLDGVFIVIKREVFKKVRYDESNPAAWHFYDLDYTLQADKSGYKCAVGNIYITHTSAGLESTNDVEWLKGQEWFLTKWCKKYRQQHGSVK